MPVAHTHYSGEEHLECVRKQALRAAVESPWTGQKRQQGSSQGPAGMGGSDGHPPGCSPLQSLP